jgi:hypothetical protein
MHLTSSTLRQEAKNGNEGASRQQLDTIQQVSLSSRTFRTPYHILIFTRPMKTPSYGNGYLTGLTFWNWPTQSICMDQSWSSPSNMEGAQDPKCMFFSWLVLHVWILTTDRPFLCGWPNDHICHLCLSIGETTVRLQRLTLLSCSLEQHQDTECHADSTKWLLFWVYLRMVEFHEIRCIQRGKTAAQWKITIHPMNHFEGAKPPQLYGNSPNSYRGSFPRLRRHQHEW